MSTPTLALIENVEHWPFVPVLTRIGMAAGMGLFIGLEREHSQKFGVRTFALAGLLGCAGGLMGDMFAAFALGFVALSLAWTNYRRIVARQKPAFTTSLALAIVAFAGVLYGDGHVFTPTVIAVLTAGLLAWKQPLSRFVGVLTTQELRSAILLSILTFVVFPVLPAEPVDHWGLVNPRENWASVIIIAGIGFVNYILMRWLGPRGMEITAFFGGLVNSRKVVVELTTRLQQIGPALLPSAYRGIMLATGAMLIRNGLIVAVLALPALVSCAIPLTLMLLATAALAQRMSFTRPDATQAPTLVLESPFQLSAALKFGFVFMALNVAGALAQRHLGAASFYVVCGLGGLLSSGSSIAAAATLIAHHEISVSTGVNGIVLSSLVSVLTNVPVVLGLVREPRFSRRVSWSLAAVAGVGTAGLAVAIFFPR